MPPSDGPGARLARRGQPVGNVVFELMNWENLGAFREDNSLSWSAATTHLGYNLRQSGQTIKREVIISL